MKYWIAIIVAILITLGGILSTTAVQGQELPTETLTIIETITESIPGPTETVTIPGPTSTETVTIAPPGETITETETEVIRGPGDTVTVTETETIVVTKTERATERETEFLQPTDQPEPSPVATETEKVIEPPEVITRFVERFEELAWWQLTLFALAGTLIAGAVYYFGWKDRAQDESNFISNIIDSIRRR